MSGPRSVDLLVDCVACRLERGVVETYDPREPACRFGLPSRTRCKLCASATEGTFDRPARRALTEIPANRST